MSPSKSGSCRRTTKVQLPSERAKAGGWGGVPKEGVRIGEGGGGREEKNIGPAAAAQWDIKPGSFVLFNHWKGWGGDGGRRGGYIKQHFPELPF